MTLVDSHAHLTTPRFAHDLPDIRARARDAGVRAILTAASNFLDSRRAVALAEKEEMVYAAVGVHPNEALALPVDWASQIEKLTRSEKVVAIGETGLDYYRASVPHEVQKKYFGEHIALALEVKKPLVVHSRNATADALRLIEEEGRGEARGVLHCFASGEEEAEKALELGLFLSFGGPLTYPKSRKGRRIFAALPERRILLETDSPYLPPQSARGRRTEPAHVAAVAAKAAGIRRLTAEDVALMTSRNVERLFGLGLDLPKGEIAYKIRNRLYLNITNSCPNACAFCARGRDFLVAGHELRLEKEPAVEDVIAAMGTPDQVEELVFCGYGEPTSRMDVLLRAAREAKARGLRVRLDTNGLGSLLNGRDIVPELREVVDAVSVSLCAARPAVYERICRPTRNGAFAAANQFLRACARAFEEVTVTAVELRGVDTEAVRKLSQELGCRFKLRRHERVF